MRRHTTVLRDSCYPAVPGCGAIYDCRTPLRRKTVAAARRCAVLVPVLALLAIALQSCHQPTQAHPAPAPARSEQASPIPKGVCRAGFVGMWIDQATVQCLREL